VREVILRYRRPRLVSGDNHPQVNDSRRPQGYGLTNSSAIAFECKLAVVQLAAKPWYVYLLRCGDGSIYTGIARNVASRIQAHANGRGARYTVGRGPFELCAKRRCKTQGDALRLEYAIKQLPRRDKLALTLPRQLARFARATQRSMPSMVRSQKGP